MGFPHLYLVSVERGRAKLRGGGVQPPEVKANRANRRNHAQKLRQKLDEVTVYWQRAQAERAERGLPPIVGGVPFLLRIPERAEELLLRLERDYGVQVVAQYDEGFLLVASEDVTLSAFQTLTTEFENEIHGATSVASILEIYDDDRTDDRLKRILAPEVYSIWPLVDANIYIFDVSIQTAGIGSEVSNRPEKRKRETQNEYERRIHEWETAWRELQVRWDEKQIETEEEIARLLEVYNGQIIDQVGDQPSEEGGTVRLPDSFSVRIRMSGRGFTDLIKNYPHIFEANFPEGIEQPSPVAREGQPGDVQPIEPPEADAPAVCVIDAGIQEAHRLIQPAIDIATSRAFIPGHDVADRVHPHGHGTAVAGAILYRDLIPGQANGQAVCWIQNARLLNDQKSLPIEAYPPLAMREIVNFYRNGIRKTRIFNHSIAAEGPCRTQRMSVWAAAIDLLSHENDVIVIQAAGNIDGNSISPIRPGVRQHYAAGNSYPRYLREASSRVSNPAQSLQALTVGSIGLATINDGNRATIGGERRPSAFTRSGWGLWGSFKPEVVEIGGDYLIDLAQTNVSLADVACPELVRSTFSTPGSGTTRSLVGTSFATPRVSAIVAKLQQIFPDETTLLYRALIVQSARWPAWLEVLPADEEIEWMKSIGYGIPDVSRATENTDHRVTLITQGVQKVHALEAAIYTVEIPAEVRSPANEFDVRIDVTLSYSTRPRRTRSSRKGYQEVWLDWISSKKGESLADFKARALKGFGEADESDSVNWMLHEQANWGVLRGIHRNAGTVQKDWVILKAHELPETFAIAVRGHNGWSKDPNALAKFALAVTLEANDCPIPIYGRIEEQQAIRSHEIEVEIETDAPLPASR